MNGGIFYAEEGEEAVVDLDEDKGEVLQILWVGWV